MVLRKILCWIIIALMAINMFFVVMPSRIFAADSSTLPVSDTFEGLSWNIDSNGVLTIGAGELGDWTRYVGSKTPWYDYTEQITEVKTEGKVILSTGVNMFSGCSNVKRIDAASFDTSKVTNMSGMFEDCSKLEELDVSSFDTSNVEFMGSMFSGCRSLVNLDVSKFDTSKVISMSNLFCDCRSLTSLDVSKFDTSSVTNMERMFYLCESIKELDISSFDMSNVSEVSEMFYGGESLTNLNISSFNSLHAEDLSSIFAFCKSLTTLDLRCLNSSSVTSMSCMFEACSSLANIDLSSFDTSHVTSMSGMFERCSSLTTIDLSGFDTSSLTYMSEMFMDCSSLKQLDLSNFDTSNVNDMENLIYGCNSLQSFKVGKWSYGNILYGSFPKFPVNMKDADSGKVHEQYTDIPEVSNVTYVITTESPEEPDEPENPDELIGGDDYYFLGKHNNYFVNNIYDFFNITKIVFDKSCTLSRQLTEDGYKVVVDPEVHKKYKKNNPTDPRIISNHFFGVKDETNPEAARNALIEVSDEHGATYVGYYDSVYPNQARAYLAWRSRLDWTGGCFGIAYSSILAMEGRLDHIFGKNSYYSLGLPKDNNHHLRDVVNYYQMLQHAIDLNVDYITYSKPKYGFSTRKKSLTEFLKLLVKEAKRSQDTNHPFILSYRHTTGGHSVVVCGYAIDPATSDHMIKIWDTNGYDRYIYFRVFENYSGFVFTDENGNEIHKVYNDIEFHGIDTLANTNTIAKAKGSSKNYFKGDSFLTIPAYEKFTITNDQGKELSFDGDKYTATMNVYDEKVIIDNEPTNILSVDESSTYVVTDLDDSTSYSFSTNIGGEFCGVETKGADQIVLDENGIRIEGNSFEYSLTESKENGDIESVTIDGSAEGMVLASLDDEFSLYIDHGSDSTLVTVNANGEEQQSLVQDTTDFIHVSPSTDGVKIDTTPIDPSLCSHKFGSWIIIEEATEIAEGSRIRTCSNCGYTEEDTIPVFKPTLKAVKISKVAAGKKSGTVKWKKISKKNLKKIKKVQIQYSTDKKFRKGVKTKYASAKKTSYKIKKLKKGKKYYVRIRAYTKSRGKVHVSKWSSVKKFKAK